MGQHNQYSFPVLNDHDLLPCLRDLGISMTAQNLARPTAELVRPAYESTLLALTGVTREELQQPVFEAIAAFHQPELHDEAVPAITLLRHLRALHAAAGVRDFNLQDVHKPDPGRLRRNLSALVNLAKFREEKLGPYTACQEEGAAALGAVQALQAELQGLEEQLQALRRAAEAELPAVAEVEAENQRLSHEAQALNRQHAAAAKEVNALKSELDGVAAGAGEDKFRLQCARLEHDRLQGLIVESPERLAAQQAEVSAEVERQRGGAGAADRRFRELQSRQDAVGKVERDIQKLLRGMSDLEREHAAKKEASRAAKELQGELSAAGHEASQLAARQLHLQRQAALQGERAQRAQQQAEAKREAAAGAVEEAARERAAAQARNAANAAQLAEHEGQAAKVQAGMAAARRGHEAAAQGALARLGELAGSVEAYHRRLEGARRPLTDLTDNLQSLRL